MKLSSKITISMGILALLMAGMGLFMINQMSTINEATEFMADNRVPVIYHIGIINNSASEYRISEAEYVRSTTPEEQQRYTDRMTQYADIIRQHLEQLTPLLREETTRKILDTYMQARDTFRKNSSEVIRLAKAGQTSQALELFTGPSRESYVLMSTNLDKLVEQIRADTSRARTEAHSLYVNSRLIAIILMVSAMFIAVTLTLLMVRNTIAQLGKDPGELNAIADRVVGGDYAIDDGSIKRGVFKSIVEMVEALKTNIENAHMESDNAKIQSRKAEEAMQLAEEAGRQAQAKTDTMLHAADKLEQLGNIVSSATTELSAQIEQADKGAFEAAQRLGEAATAMNEMNATVQEVARNAGSASNASSLTKDKAEDGARIVEKSLQGIRQVHQVSIELKHDMVSLNEHAQAITRIMNVISDIADQTNLLALNAAIEAARAGDAGRGFAVVADEVRKLAEKTMASTTDVGEAIKAIQASTTKSMTSVDNAVQQIEQTTSLAGAAGEALQDIVTTVESTADQVRAIAAASEEQSAASEEINHSLEQVNERAKETASAMAESSKAVSDLAEQAHGLTLLIDEMKRG